MLCRNSKYSNVLFSIPFFLSHFSSSLLLQFPSFGLLRSPPLFSFPKDHFHVPLFALFSFTFDAWIFWEALEGVSVSFKHFATTLHMHSIMLQHFAALGTSASTQMSAESYVDPISAHPRGSKLAVACGRLRLLAILIFFLDEGKAERLGPLPGPQTKSILCLHRA